MNKSAHRAITEAALREHFSQAALAEIVSANLGQDALRFQFGHPYFHYDDNSFAESDRYVEGSAAPLSQRWIGGMRRVPAPRLVA